MSGPVTMAGMRNQGYGSPLYDLLVSNRPIGKGPTNLVMDRKSADKIPIIVQRVMDNKGRGVVITDPPERDIVMAVAEEFPPQDRGLVFRIGPSSGYESRYSGYVGGGPMCTNIAHFWNPDNIRVTEQEDVPVARSPYAVARLCEVLRNYGIRLIVIDPRYLRESR